MIINNVILLLFISICCYSQNQDSNKNWLHEGHLAVLANQSNFNAWHSGGGENSLSASIGLKYSFDYQKGLYVWDNKLSFDYGTSKLIKKIFKNNDRLELNSFFAKRVHKNLFSSIFFNFQTQTDAGLKPETDTRHSEFLSPAFYKLGAGILYKKSKDFKINFSPLLAKLISVDSKFTDYSSSFGVAKDETTRFEFGASVYGYNKSKLMENVYLENIIHLFSNYLDKPENIDLDYQVSLMIKANKYIATNIVFHTIYDHNTFKGFQTREVIALGVNYSF